MDTTFMGVFEVESRVPRACFDLVLDQLADLGAAMAIGRDGRSFEIVLTVDDARSLDAARAKGTSLVVQAMALVGCSVTATSTQAIEVREHAKLLAAGHDGWG